MTMVLSGDAGVTFPNGSTQAQGRPDSPQSMVRVNTANGFGSGSTVIRRLSNVVLSQGADITYTTQADTSGLGSVFTVNTSGVYAISYSDGFAVGSSPVGISVNSTQLTTSVAGLADASTRLAMCMSTAADAIVTASWTGYLAAGSVIRPHTTTGVNNPTTTSQTQFTIVRVA